MYILYGHSIDEGVTFIGPFGTEQEVRAAQHDIDFNEEFADMGLQYHWRIIELHDGLRDAKTYPSTMTQVR